MAAVYPALATSRCTFTERRKHTTSGTCRVRCRRRARNPLVVEHQPHPRCYTSSSAGLHQGPLHVGAWNGGSFVKPGSECCTHRPKRFIPASKLSLCYDPAHWFSFWQCNGSDLNPTFRNELTPAHRRIESWAPKNFIRSGRCGRCLPSRPKSHMGVACLSKLWSSGGRGTILV
jgi:hypothetical protein